jgi:DNA-binding transcriptional MerR regulator
MGMSVYSIKDLEHLSGIKAHTIRIWEQRYNLFSPQRTATNIRYYNDEDVKLILNIATLKNNGMKISKIVEMPADIMQEEVQKVSQDNKSDEDQISALTLAMVDLNETRFSEVLNRNIDHHGFERAMMEVIYPFMRKIGILWLTNAINPAQEHFITHLVRQKIIAATDHTSANASGPLYFLFLPEGELHELGLLFANYILRSRGYRTIFFGQTVPLDALEEVYHKLHPECIMTAMTTAPDPSEVQKYVDRLGNKFKDCKICITGRRIIGQDISLPDNASILNRFEDLSKITAEVAVNQS